MSKILILAMLFALVACEVEDPKNENGGRGSFRQFQKGDPNIVENEKVQAVCDALERRSSMLHILEGDSYDFDYAQKDCDDEAMPAGKLVPTYITNSESGYIFKSKNGETFGFPVVDTKTKGVIAELCDTREELTNEIRLGKNAAIWWSTNTTFCSSNSNTVCIHLQRGTSTDGEWFKVHTDEWIKVRVFGEREGFILDRKLQTDVGCGAKKFRERRAILK